MITTRLYPDGSLHSHMNDGVPSHDPERMRSPEPAQSMLTRLEYVPTNPKSHRRKPSPVPRIGGLVGLLLTLTACGGGTFTPVAAPTVPVPEPLPVSERVYIDTLDAGQIAYSSETAIIETGWRTCDYLDAGGSMFEATTIYAEAGYSSYDAGYLVGAAAGALCPEHTLVGA